MSSSNVWLGLGGVVVGGALTGGTAVIQEWRRRVFDKQSFDAQALRDDAVRLDQRRFEAYVALVTNANRIYALCKYGDTLPESSRDLKSAHEQFLSGSSPAFLLTSDPHARDCIAGLVHAVRILVESAAASEVLGDTRDLEPVLDEHRAAVKAVERAMRDEIGIPSSRTERQPDPSPATVELFRERSKLTAPNRHTHGPK